MKQPYETVADDIVMRIRRGEWRRGEQVPAIRTLESLYPHSRMTLHKALRHLVARGYLHTERGRGTFVRTTHVRDRVGILAGGITGGHDRAPFTAASLDCACAYFNRCGMDSRVYSDDPLSPTRFPAALNEDLDARRLKGLVTIQSSFTYRHMRTELWQQHAVPHVDIGSVPAPYRVYVDFPAFVDRALDVTRREGRRQPMLIAKGGMQDFGALRSELAVSGLRIHDQPLENAQPKGHEEWGFHLMQELRRRGEQFDALIVPDDGVAKGIAHGALACGMEIPKDCLVVALGNHGIDVFYPAPVIRLDVDVEAIVIGAGDLLLRLMSNPDLPPETILLPCDRESWAGQREPARFESALVANGEPDAKPRNGRRRAAIRSTAT